MPGTKGTGDSVGLFSELKQYVFAKEQAAVEDTVMLSGSTLDTSGDADAELDEGYALVKVNSSGSSEVDADEVGKFREFDSDNVDLDEVSDVVILLSPIDLSEHDGDVAVPVAIHGFIDAEYEHHNGTLDYDNNARLHILPM